MSPSAHILFMLEITKCNATFSFRYLTPSFPNSAEDLDEVDRLANHPVLRSVPLGCGVNHADLFRQREIGKLRKSRSVTGTETAAAGGGIR